MPARPMTFEPRRPRGPRPRRGIAMLLVLIGVMTATIVTTAYLASRDNSGLVGRNVAGAATARWAALSGLEIGVAIVQTERDWRTMHVDGRLVTGFPVGDAAFDLDLIDVATGQPPTEATREVEITATARVDGISQSAVGLVSVIRDGQDEAIDADGSEFAVVADVQIELKDEGLITRWPAAPLSPLGRRVAIGIRGTHAGAIDLQDDAALVDASVYHGPGASNSLVLNAAGPDVTQVALLDAIPLPAAPDPGVAASAGSPPDLHLLLDDVAIAADERYRQIKLNGSTLALQGPLTLVAEEVLELMAGSTLIVEGDVTVVAFDDFKVDQSAIELAAGATLDLYLGKAVDLNGAYLGEDRAGSTAADNTGTAPWMDPQRLRLFGMPDSAHWVVEGTSVVKASVYAPDRRLVVRGDSALYGRAAVGELEMSSGAAIFYDHLLDRRQGVTEPTSLAFDGFGRIIAELRTLASLSPEDLAGAGDAAGVPFSAGLLDFGAEALAALIPPILGATDPTPRPVLVEFELVRFGEKAEL